MGGSRESPARPTFIPTQSETLVLNGEGEIKNLLTFRK